MKSIIANLLQCERQPVAIIASEQKPQQCFMFPEEAKGCIIALLNAASKGNIAALSKETVGCPGGKSGTGFQPFQLGTIEYFLSIGGKGPKEGEFYKESPELAAEFIRGLPNIETKKYLILKPYEQLSKNEIPLEIVFLVNADELSALVTLANYDQPTQNNVEIRFAAGCAQTFLYPIFNQQNGYDICTIGLTDPSARKCIEKDLLAFCIPFRRFLVMEQKAEGSFLTKSTWQTLLNRKDISKN